MNQPSKRWRNRSVQRCFKRTLITTATVTSFPQSCRFSWMVRHAAWTLKRFALKADGQTSLFKLMSKGYRGEVAKFSELVWFLLPSSRSWRNSGDKLTGLESRNDLVNICSRSEVRLIQPQRFRENHVMNS